MKNYLYKFVSLSLLLCFSINILIHSFVLISFKLNQEYIALNLCVEKDVEKSTCKGNCQLKKSIAKIEKSTPSQDDSQLTSETHITVLFSVDLNHIKIPKIRFSKQFFTHNFQTKLNGFESYVFRPPIC